MVAVEPLMVITGVDTVVGVGDGLSPLTLSTKSLILAIIGLRFAALSCVVPSVKYGYVNF
jgi:hypothetical protein